MSPRPRLTSAPYGRDCPLFHLGKVKSHCKLTFIFFMLIIILVATFCFLLSLFLLLKELFKPFRMLILITASIIVIFALKNHFLVKSPKVGLIPHEPLPEGIHLR